MSDLLPPIVGVLKSDITQWVTGMKQASATSDATAKEASGHFENLKNNISAHWKSITAVVSGVISVAAVENFAKGSIDKFQSVSLEVAKMSRLTGESVETMSRLRHAGEETGVGVDTLDNAFKRLSKSVQGGSDAEAKQADTIIDHNAKLQDQVTLLQAVAHPTDAQTAKLADLQAQMADNNNTLEGLNVNLDKFGVSTTDAEGKTRSMHDILLDVATRFHSMPDGIEKNALAMKLFGKAGTDLIPLLNKGADGIAELEKESDKLGTTIGQKDVDAVKKNVIAKREMHAVIEGLQIQIGRYLYPAVTQLTQWFAENLPPAIDMVRTAFETVQPVIGGIIATIKFLTEHTSLLIGVAAGVAVGLAAWAVAATVAAIANFTLEGSLIAALAPFIAIGVAVAAVTAGVIYAYQHWAWFKATVDGVAAFMVWFWREVIQPFAEWLTHDFVGKLELVGRVIVAALSGGMSEVALAIYHHWDDILAFFKGLPGKISGAAAGLWDGFTNGLSTLADTLTAPFTAAFGGIAHLWNETIGSLSFEIPGWIPGVGGHGWHAPRIGNYDRGGIVPGTLGMPQLAIVHGGEEVLTPDQRGGGRNYTIINQIAPGGDLVAAGQHTVNAIVAFERSSGSGWRA